MSLSGDEDKHFGELSEPTRQFITVMLDAFPEWADALQVPETRETLSDEYCWFCIVPPKHPTHRLYVVIRGNSVEVRYNDGEPPGPAEKIFVDLDRSAGTVAEAVIGFVRDIISGRVLVVRERLGILARVLRRDCGSLARFRNSSEIEHDHSGRFAAVYSWT